MGSKFENFDFLRDCQKVETEYWPNDSVLPCLSVNLFKFATACGEIFCTGMGKKTNYV